MLRDIYRCQETGIKNQESKERKPHGRGPHDYGLVVLLPLLGEAEGHVLGEPLRLLLLLLILLQEERDEREEGRRGRKEREARGREKREG